jgi:hypothetical protein
MSLFRRFQAAIIALMLVLLASPAIAACCAWTPGAPPCCHKAEGDRLAAPCCMSSSQGPQQQPPASVAKLSKLESATSVSVDWQAPLAIADTRATARVEQVTGPPGSDALYLRLSVIRR